MSRIVIVGYRPKPGCDEALGALMKTHVDRLRKEGLATDRKSIVMRADDGTFVEVFEWKSEEAMQSAHSNANVRQIARKSPGHNVPGHIARCIGCNRQRRALAFKEHPQVWDAPMINIGVRPGKAPDSF